VSLWVVLGAAAALSVERACYVWIARAPAAFRRVCAHPLVVWLGEPVAVVGALFCGFKVLQLSVFVWWCYLLGDSRAPATLDGLALAVGSAFDRGRASAEPQRVLSAVYGDRLGYEVPRCQAFPFSVLSHPQYVGTVMTIWGVFVVMRFPHDDWILLPALETVYYVVGTWLEPNVIGTSPCRRRSFAEACARRHGPLP
jgi:hypothetical protein